MYKSTCIYRTHLNMNPLCMKYPPGLFQISSMELKKATKSTYFAHIAMSNRVFCFCSTNLISSVSIYKIVQGLMWLCNYSKVSDCLQSWHNKFKCGIHFKDHLIFWWGNWGTYLFIEMPRYQLVKWPIWCLWLPDNFQFTQILLS